MRALVALLCFVPIDAYAETVVQQHIEVDTTGDALVITFDATLDIPSATDRIVMFRPFAPVESATLDGQPITWSPSPLAPDVLDAGSVATPVGPGEVTLRVRIVGAPSCPGQCWHDATKTILTPSWVGAAWYYVDVFDASPFTGTIAVRARSNAHVSSGQGAPSRSEDLQDGTQRVTFAVELPTTLLSVYVGTQERVVADGPFPVTAHRTEEAPQDVVAQAVDRASHGVLALESFLGPYPTDAAHLVVAPRDAAFGGMGMMGTVFISEIIFSAFAFILDAGVIHELAHAYWGHVANGGVDESAPFFSEALAEYSAWRAIGILEGDTRRRDGVRMNSVWYMYARPDGVDAPIVGANTGRSPAYVHATYHKGSSVLRMLEHAVGAEAFDGVLRALLAAGPAGLDVPTLRAALVEAGHPSVSSLDAWLYGTGFPTIATRRDGDFLGLDVDGEWALDLPVVITEHDGTSREVLLPLRGGDNAFEVGGVAEIAIDPAWTHVRAVHATEDVTLDGIVDAADLLAVALHAGGAIPTQRRLDGGYDPLFDLDRDGRVDATDLSRVDAAVERSASRSD